MAAEALSVSSVRHFCTKTSTDVSAGTKQTIFRPIASVDQRDLEFFIPAEHDSYIDFNVRLYVRGKLTTTDGKD